MSSPAQGVTLCFLVSVLLAIILPFPAAAQIPIGYPPIYTWGGRIPPKGLLSPAWEGIAIDEGDILVDAFEYWESPLEHGWQLLESPYVTYGFGMGFVGVFATVLDLQQGTRVLDVRRPASVFLLSTLNQGESIRRPLVTPPSAMHLEGQAWVSLAENPVLSLDFRAPLGTQDRDIFDMTVTGKGGGRKVVLRLISMEPPSEAGEGAEMHTASGMYRIVPLVSVAGEGLLEVKVYLGRGFLDGLWHDIRIDCPETVEDAVEGEGLDPGEWCMDWADAIVVSGRMMFRLDNILFRRPEYMHQGMRMQYPNLFETGPLYAEIFEPYRYLFIADYKAEPFTVYDVQGRPAEVSEICDLMLNPANFIFVEDPNDPNDPVVRYWTDLGADPNLFGVDADPAISDILDRDFTVDLNLPIFADPNLRLQASGPGPVAQSIIDQGTLGWNATVIRGYCAVDIMSLVNPLAIYPYDGMPTYLPEYYDPIRVAETYGKPFYRPDLVFILESALWNAGVTVWPMIAYFDYTPMDYEDLVLDMEVTDGVHSDRCTVFIAVVDYRVENYPPVAQLPFEEQVFYTGEKGEYQVNFIDPDCFIFSLAEPAVPTHTPGFPVSASYRTDMEGFVWGGTISGLLPPFIPWYMPWPTFIDPSTGLISFVPKKEAVHDVVINCTDARGAVGFANFSIFVLDRGTGSNHSPVILESPSRPLVVRAGEEIVLTAPDIRVEHPDGDQVYASCNIGALSRAPDGSFLWKFQSFFPGTYQVEIKFYDIRGGYDQAACIVEVKPWWSY
ncbi:MAG: hypothetical protein ACMUIL_02795 [bacterium]